MRIIYLAPHRVILEAENNSDREILPDIAHWLEGVNESEMLAALQDVRLDEDPYNKVDVYGEETE